MSKDQILTHLILKLFSEKNSILKLEVGAFHHAHAEKIVVIKGKRKHYSVQSTILMPTRKQIVNKTTGFLYESKVLVIYTFVKVSWVTGNANEFFSSVAV